MFSRNIGGLKAELRTSETGRLKAELQTSPHQQIRIPVSLVPRMLDMARGAVRFVRGDHLMFRARIGLAVMTLSAGSARSCEVGWRERVMTTRATQLAVFVGRETAESLNSIEMDGVELLAAPLVLGITR